MSKRIKKIESGSNMDGSNMEGTKPNIKRVRLNSPNAPEYPPRVSLGRKRIDWGKKGKTPTGKGGSGSANPVGNFGAAIEKEDGGDGAFGDGGGTVFTSTNAGIFTPTHGDSGKPKRVKAKKKRSGIERLGVFLTDGSPEKKMKKKTAVLKAWVENQQEEELPQFVEEGAEEEDTSNKVVAEQLDMERKIDMIRDEEKQKEDDNKPSADIASSHITDVQLAKQPQAFGNPQDDELKRGAKKDKERKATMELEIENILKDFGIHKSVKKEGVLLDLKKSHDSATIAKYLMRV
jgi:hypothetical protein